MSEDSAVKLKPFSGKEDDWVYWSPQFEARAEAKGYRVLLDATETAPNDDEVLDPTSEANKIKLRKLNKQGYSELMSLMSGSKAKVAFLLVKKARTAGLPNGSLYQAWVNLKERYQPKGVDSAEQVLREYNECYLGKREDPEEWIARKDELRMRLQIDYGKKDYDDDDFKAAIIYKLPEEYHSEKTVLRDKYKSMSVAQITIMLRERYKELSKGNNKKSDDDEEIALAGTQQQRGIKCYNCQGFGHIARDCTKKKVGGGQRFKGKCNGCGKFGHKEADCWEKESNASKRPSGWKPKRSEINAASTDEAEYNLTEVDWLWDEDYGITSSDEEEDDDMVFDLEDDVVEETPICDKAVEMALIDAKEAVEDPNVWILDTGASTNSTGNSQGVIEIQDAEGSVTRMGNGATVKSKGVGKLPVMVCDKNQKEINKGMINDLYINPGSPFNLIAGGKLLQEGYMVTGNCESLVFTKGKTKLVFDMKIHTRKGVLYAIYLKRLGTDTGAVQQQVITKTIKKAHETLGHMDEEKTRAVARSLKWTITKGTMNSCENCAIGKAKSKDISLKDGPKEKAKEVNGRIYLDISSIRNPEKNGVQPTKPRWCIKVDERTGFKKSDFYETKDGMVEPTCEMFYQWKMDGKPVQVLRMDNAGENKKLHKALNSSRWKMYPEVEYTAKDTPKQNHQAEVAFDTIYGRGRAMMTAANVPTGKRYLVAYKAFETATKLDGLIPITIDGVTKTRVEHWSGKLPRYANHLRTWGEAGVVKTKTDTTPKLNDRGEKCMFVGYADNHDGDCYEMLNWSTKRITLTRDVRWLNKMYFDKSGIEFVSEISDDEDNEVQEEEANKATDGMNDNIPIELEGDEDQHESAPIIEPVADPANLAQQGTATTRSGRAVKPVEKLNLVQAVAEYMQESYEEMGITNYPEDFDEIIAVGAGIGGGFTNTSELIPMKYDEAMKKDPKGWEEAVDEEHDRMVSHKVWRPEYIKDIPKHAKILTSTWAMKQKANGTKRARINARGYEQKEGEHYASDGTSSPVVNEASIFIILILMVLGRLYGELNDVKGAFLNGEFSNGEKLYMRVPQGFEKFYPPGVVLLLLKTIYGLKQAAYEYWRMLLKAIKAVGLERCKADPCVYFKWKDGKIMLWASWVDDLLSCGKETEVKKGREELKKYFDLDEVGPVQEYVGCKVNYNKEEGYIHLTQPVLIQSFEDEFELPSREHKTPAAQGEVLCKGEPLLNEKEHRNYRKGVGKLLHLSKYARPDICNAVRELTRFGGAPNVNHYKAMHRCMKYAVDTKNRGLLLKPWGKWDGGAEYKFTIFGVADSNFATCPDTRKSVSGWSAYLNGAPYTRKSKTQPIVTLSVTEAECLAATSCIQDMLYGMRFLESLGLKVKKPMTLYMDNKGGVDLFNNWSISGHTRAISVRLAYVRELKEMGIVQVEWIKGDDNPADIYTKNLDAKAFEKHAMAYCADEVNGTVEYKTRENYVSDLLPIVREE